MQRGIEAERDKSSHRDKKRERSERTKVILPKRDTSRVCCVTTEIPQRNTEIYKIESCIRLWFHSEVVPVYAVSCVCVRVCVTGICGQCSLHTKGVLSDSYEKKKNIQPDSGPLVLVFLAAWYAQCASPLPCVCVSGSLFRGLLRRRLSGFFPPGLLIPPPDPSDEACDLLLDHNEQNSISI